MFFQEERQGVGFGLQRISGLGEFGRLLECFGQGVVIRLEGLAPGGEGDVLGLEVIVGRVEGGIQRHQLLCFGRGEVGLDGLSHGDDALVHQLLFHLGLEPLEGLQGGHLGLLLVDLLLGLGDLVGYLRPAFLSVGDLGTDVVLLEVLAARRGFGDLVGHLRPAFFLFADLDL